ncbi:hypothetical protein C0Q44_28610 [Paenibacillus sp. PCH8]|nr:hypothetical protein C0Q44_27810 [Paenibacillus sp. PCH8]PQP80375.1 hypothetical protein C0Q44_28610 [Paenibacillus sp. PCH8]
MRFFLKISLPLFFFAFFWIFTLQTQVNAASDVDFLLSPVKEIEQSSGYYRDEVTGGETKQYTFYLKNLVKKPIDLWIYPADAAPMVNGGKSYMLKGEKNTSVGAWIAPSKAQKVRLKPLEKLKYVYTVKVPKDLDPGEYVGGIVAEQIPAEEASPSQVQDKAVLLIERIPRIGVQIVLEKDKQAAVQDMSIDDFKHSYISNGYSQLTIKLANTGNILQRPSGLIMIRDANGKGIFSQSYDAAAEEKSIYAGKTADMVYHVKDQILWPGEYSAYFETNFNGKKVSRTFNFTITEADAKLAQDSLSNAGLLQGRGGIIDWLQNHPWAIVAGAFVLILIFGTFFLLLFLILRRKKKEDEQDRQQVRRQTLQTPQA